MTDIPLPDMPDGPSPDDLLRMGLRKRYLELGAAIEQYENERERIKAHMRVLGRGSHDIGDGRVTISPNRTFNTGYAEKVLTEINPALVEQCSTLKLDSAKVRNILSPEMYERCQKYGDDKVTIE